MKVLELFSGTESISNEFRKRGHEAFTVDWNPAFNPTLSADISKLTAEDVLLQFGKPDIIFAAPDCSTFSLLAMARCGHRRKNYSTGEMEAVSPYAKFCDMVDKHVLELIHELQPKVFIIENPRAGMRTMKWMRGIPRYTTTYCQYGEKYMKPTDFWSNIDLKLKAPCKAGSPYHERATDFYSGVVSLENKIRRSMYPKKLVEHIADVCEEYVLQYNLAA